MKHVRTLLVWAIGLSFIAIGIMKYLDLDEMSESVFNRAHYPHWFFYVVATIEFSGGVLLLLTPTTKRIGSLLIALVMLGALGTRWLLNEHSKTLILPALVFLIALLMSFNLAGKATLKQNDTAR